MGGDDSEVGEGGVGEIAYGRRGCDRAKAAKVISTTKGSNGEIQRRRLQRPRLQRLSGDENGG
ncbi:hypothetical protein HPP92_010281 [Vanilla planifolia]|uniref:Uncharacterized protein n=1 Tax=Vanilla planifolia TaxID=51239 RepID=A0A835V1P0_VANPL|nr:hypothetical protein HPP92_010281 [Vanilla planifolia]